MDLAELKASVDRAHAQESRPLAPDEASRPYEPLEMFLTDDDWRLLRKAGHAVREQHPQVFGLFTENMVARLMIEELVAEDQVPTLDGLAARLRTRARELPPQLVMTPLANIETPEPVTDLGDGIVLQRAILGDEWIEERFANSDEDTSIEVQRILGDRFAQTTRWFQPPRPSGSPKLDTRRGATLISVEEGSIPVGLARARAKAQYALAVWAVLAPPESFQLLPDIGLWGPQPFLELGQRYKELEHGPWGRTAMTKGTGIREWHPYQAPAPEQLRLPFRAMEANKRSARSLLSASLALFQASRRTRFAVSERVRYIHTAIEALCEQKPGLTDPARWEAVAARYSVWEEVAKRGYDLDVGALQLRLRDARNIATHGADVVLLDLGFEPGGERALGGKRSAATEHLAVSALEADLSPLISVVRYVIRALFTVASENEWSDERFDEQFR